MFESAGRVRGVNCSGSGIDPKANAILQNHVAAFIDIMAAHNAAVTACAHTEFQAALGPDKTAIDKKLEVVCQGRDEKILDPRDFLKGICDLTDKEDKRIVDVLGHWTIQEAHWNALVEVWEPIFDKAWSFNEATCDLLDFISKPTRDVGANKCMAAIKKHLLTKLEAHLVNAVVVGGEVASHVLNILTASSTADATGRLLMESITKNQLCVDGTFIQQYERARATGDEIVAKMSHMMSDTVQVPHFDAVSGVPLWAACMLPRLACVLAGASSLIAHIDSVKAKEASGDANSLCAELAVLADATCVFGSRRDDLLATKINEVGLTTTGAFKDILSYATNVLSEATGQWVKIFAGVSKDCGVRLGARCSVCPMHCMMSS